MHTRFSAVGSAVLSAALVLLSPLSAPLSGQGVPPEVARFGYADTIFLNGKIVSMDDVSTSTRVGNVYQAIAVKNDRIMKLGTSDSVRSMAGPETRIFDLKGRLMIPGIIESHQHIYGDAVRQLSRFGYKYPPHGVVVTAQAERDLEKTQANIREKLQETVNQVEPGEWIVLRVQGHPEAPDEARFWGFTRRLINRKTIDLWTPKNPVLVNPGLRGNLNSRALEVLNDFLPGYSKSIQETMHGDRIGEDIPALGWVGSQEMSVITWELFLQQLPPATLAQALKLVSEEFGALGVTTVSTRLPFPKVMTGYATLAGLGQMPIRLAAHYEVHRMPTEPDQTRQIYRRTGVLNGIGDDYLWIDGVASERWDSIYPESCTGPDTQAPPNIKAREVCPQKGDLPWDVLENALRSGWRLAGIHMCGSQSARAFIDMIEGVRIDNGWSMEDIRRMQITTEHCDVVGKQPELLNMIKDYGLMMSCAPDLISEAPSWIRDYGPQMNDFVLPFKTWIEAGVNLVGQHYGGGALGRPGEGSVGPGFQPPFFQLWQVVTRKFDGKVWQPEERIDRVHALKMWTSWASRYVTKPDELGTLEEGKLADLLVVDRDYFSIPVDDILKIRPLMTMVGGEMIALQAPLARDFNVDPVGFEYDFADSDVAHIGRPLSERGEASMD